MYLQFCEHVKLAGRKIHVGISRAAQFRDRSGHPLRSRSKARCPTPSGSTHTHTQLTEEATRFENFNRPGVSSPAVVHKPPVDFGSGLLSTNAIIQLQHSSLGLHIAITDLHSSKCLRAHSKQLGERSCVRQVLQNRKGLCRQGQNQSHGRPGNICHHFARLNILTKVLLSSNTTKPICDDCKSRSLSEKTSSNSVVQGFKELCSYQNVVWTAAHSCYRTHCSEAA